MKQAIEQRMDKEKLVDIRTVAVDKHLPKHERLKEFVHQIRNPYRFSCGDFIVNASFSKDGITLEERLQGIIR